MAKKQLTPQLTLLRYRFFCEDDQELGKWRDNEDVAIADATDHLNKPGNGNHVVHIITNETRNRQFALKT